MTAGTLNRYAEHLDPTLKQNPVFPIDALRRRWLQGYARTFDGHQQMVWAGSGSTDAKGQVHIHFSQHRLTLLPRLVGGRKLYQVDDPL